MRGIILALGLAAASPAVAETAQTPFAVGQVWTLKEAPAGSRFIVMKIEPFGDEKVVHGTPTGFPSIPANGYELSVNGGHMPFDEQALRRSVDGLERSGAKVTRDFEAGYAQWKAANGGAFTLTVPEAVASVAEGVRSGNR